MHSLKVFGKVLKRAASSYGFVGYNGSDQFIGMFEECTVQRAEDFKQYLEELVHYHNVQTPNVTIASKRSCFGKQISQSRFMI